MNHSTVGRLLALIAVIPAVSGAGCTFGQSGIEPPTDRIFLPAGIAADPAEDLLYVVNSNSDLRFNAGTITVVDMAAARALRAQAAIEPPPICEKTRFSRTEDVPENYCCRDLVDSNVINCLEPQFIQADATVSLGSFGGAIALQEFERGGELIRRLYVAVRAEPSITFADVTVRNGRAAIRCTGPRSGDAPQTPGTYCDDGWRLRRPAGVTPGALVLPEEPHLLELDRAMGVLYVGHLTVSTTSQVEGGGISSVDVCNPASPNSVRFAGLARTTFLPEGLTQAVAALSPGDPAAPDTRVYATARYSSSISGMVLRSPGEQACDSTSTEPPVRDLTLVPSESFSSPAFLPYGSDIRGILFSSDGGKAFVLHRNDSVSASNPAALVALDRTPRSDGSLANSPLAITAMCGGPTDMKLHDAGRGPRIYVTCYDDGQVYIVDPDTLGVLASIDVGAGPTSLVFSPLDPGIAYIASYANSHLSIIDLQPGSPTENHTILRVGLPHGYGE